MKKHILKAYFGDIFFEFILQDKDADLVCYLPGFPSSNVYNSLMYFLYEKGFHVFTIRYRGSYQSKGTFLDKNIIEDLKGFINHLKKGKVTSLWDLKKFTFKVKNKYLFASSFGGAIACGLAVNSNYFDKMVLFAPVWDFSKHNKKFSEQDLQHLIQFVKRAYQNCYRFSFDNIEKELEQIKEIQIKNYLDKLNLPIFVFHGTNDNTVSIKHTSEILKIKKNIKLIKHKLGHGPKTELLEMYEKDFDTFLKK